MAYFFNSKKILDNKKSENNDKSNLDTAKLSNLKKSSIKYFSLNLFDKPVKYKVGDEQRKDFEAESCYNYNSQSGILKNGVGFETALYPTSESGEEYHTVNMPHTGDIKKIWYYPYYETNNNRRVDKIIFYGTDNQLWTFALFYPGQSVVSMLDEEFGITLSKLPVGLSYRIYNEDFMLFSTENGLIAYTTHLLPGIYNNCPEFISMTKIYDLLWAIPQGDRNKVIYNEDLNPIQWDSENQKFDLSEFGQLCKLINFDDYLFVFRDYGITKISRYGTGGNFSVSNIYDSGSRIYADTICVTGDDITFFTDDGLYVFNGSSCKPLRLGFESLIKKDKNKQSCATWLNGKYYLACYLSFDDGKQIGCESQEDGFINNALVCIDPISSFYSITRGVDICSLTSVSAGIYSEVLASFNGSKSQEIGMIRENGSFFDSLLSSYYKSKTTDFGFMKKTKKIKSFKIKSLYDCKINICSDKENQIIEVVGKNSWQTIKCNVKGETFFFEISSVGVAQIYPPKFEVQIFD